MSYKIERENDALLAHDPVGAYAALLDVVEAAKRSQVAQQAIVGAHGVDEAHEYFAAKNALTAALAQWEKTK